ncbi:acyl-CoA dehydrogenase, N-terminal domain protein [Acinetobacter sp. 263903-1]|uniref:acyl-CoA dehydrogenase family protein n=1 Tax=unclassified Acinetobacter calcoaceticus/baumannii complex TaxID=2881046 RepID=UPI00045058A1|nr:MULTISPECIES: acyl-CoA dehydrogenase family protein [unclassified Acinetobacter calcoaceticus/baumannii complex]EXB72888.1 acyl-CoA dehydrogenase, N-terminal domain protein [Acinetobacter sp. 230853]EXB84546.1 acyl-CoA dehydrogenase, N-terminal domain protein [Acinetobacter sp. 272263]EXC31874.1 acyl-CoA dehydrogenase, N-terminal domain protein [Acinetobacter sp. 869535]KCX37164.1 acyl-CoA dehydrogenase, N-terminal domain protein [Acinetobacter sp. 263903-1]
MFELSSRAQDFVQRTRKFIETEIEPVEKVFWEEVHQLNPDGNWKSWQWPEQLTVLKEKAKAAGLWNMFLPDAELGAGLSVQEYAHIAELTGRSLLAPTVFNCNAPDSGNMELLWRYGSEEQKQQWLSPLLAGEIRSVFCMTEPAVASSDATNMQATAVIEGDEIVLNGRKWWSSGLGDPNAKVIIFMAHTPDESKDRHHQHSMVLVPIDTAGVTIERMLPVFGDYDAPHGHGEISFNNVRVPLSHFIGGAGQGVEIAQGRLGPGRIHHCMRCIGAAEKSLDLMIERGMSRTAFGKEILKLGGNLERVAEARVAIDQARLLTLYAAYKMDTLGNMAALTEISAIKVVAPSVLEKVVDMAIQIHGGAGMSRDTVLTGFFAQARSLRLADGPDEVHKGMIAKLELAKRGYSTRRKA